MVWLLWLFGCLELMWQGHFGRASSRFKQCRMSDSKLNNCGPYYQHIQNSRVKWVKWVNWVNWVMSFKFPSDSGDRSCCYLCPKLIPYNHHTITSSVLVRSPQILYQWKALLMEILMMPSKSPEPPAVEWFLSCKVCVLGKLFFGRTKWQTMSPHPPVPCKMEAVAPPDHTFSQGQPYYPLPCRMEATAQPHHTFQPKWQHSPLANVLIMAQQVASLPLSNRTKRSSSRESNAPNSSHFG